MASQDLRTEVAQLIQKSDLNDQQKQKMLFALPKMNDDEVAKLHADLQQVQSEEAEAIHQKIEGEVAQDVKREEALTSLAGELGAEPNVAMSDDEAQEITDEILDEVANNPEKLTQLLIALGPKEIKKLEKAVELMGADPNNEFSQEDIKDTVEKLRDFSVKVSKAAHDLDEELQEEFLKEDIRLEQEKQEILEGYLNDLETISESA